MIPPPHTLSQHFLSAHEPFFTHRSRSAHAESTLLSAHALIPPSHTRVNTFCRLTHRSASAHAESTLLVDSRTVSAHTHAESTLFVDSHTVPAHAHAESTLSVGSRTVLTHRSPSAHTESTLSVGSRTDPATAHAESTLSSAHTPFPLTHTLSQHFLSTHAPFPLTHTPSQHFLSAHAMIPPPHTLNQHFLSAHTLFPPPHTLSQHFLSAHALYPIIAHAESALLESTLSSAESTLSRRLTHRPHTPFPLTHTLRTLLVDSPFPSNLSFLTLPLPHPAELFPSIRLIHLILPKLPRPSQPPHAAFTPSRQDSPFFLPSSSRTPLHPSRLSLLPPADLAILPCNISQRKRPHQEHFLHVVKIS